jgi:hypothetical protein
MTAPHDLAKYASWCLIALIAAVMVVPATAVLAGASLGPRISLSQHSSATTSHSSGLSRLLSGGTTPNRANLFQGIPARIAQAPWVANLIHHGLASGHLTSLPNLALLKHPLAPNGTVNPFYVAQPAPLGLTDYGLGATPYSYNTSHLMGQVTFAAPPNVTDPASTGVIEPAGQHDGFVGSVYEFGIQLNTVATNMSLPGSDQGFFWTQNVVNWNDTGIHFVDDTFNLTSATQSPFFIQPNTIYSACNNNTTGVQKVLFNYGGVFQCVGGTIPLSPAAYPVTIQLYNNATVNAQNRTQVAYGYHINEAGIHKVYSGVSDVVVFNNPNSTRPANKPGFSIDGFSGAPSGLFRDAEMDLVGDIGGDNAVFRSVSGSILLEYSNASSGGWRTVPSAFNFGGDTGETSTGIADYWTPGHSLIINQGPAMLYGLWGTPAYVSVKSGAIHLAGTISPSYGFVFVSNTLPVVDPWAGARDNLSWLPTTSTGAFNTWLPPVGAPWTTKYYVRAFADGYAQFNGSGVTKSVTTYAISMKSAPGNLNAPLYMFSNAQASSLAKAIGSSASPPYRFDSLVVNINFTFNHVNDYGYASFVLLMSAGVTNPIAVNNTYQGQDSPAGNFYIYDYAFSSGLLAPGPFNTTSLPFFTSGINIFDGSHDTVSNQMVAAGGFGLQVNLWQDTGAVVSGISSTLLSSGVWVGDSTGTNVQGVTVDSGGTGVTDIGSYHTTASNIQASGSARPGAPSTGVAGLSSVGGSFSSVTATLGATGFALGVDYGAGADYDPYYYLPGTTGYSISSVTVSNGSLGANISLSTTTSISGVWASYSSMGVAVDNSHGTSITQVQDWLLSTGASVFASKGTSVSGLSTWAYSVGVVVNGSHGFTITNVTAIDHSTAVEILHSSAGKVSYVLAEFYSTGVLLHASKGIKISHVTARFHSTGVVLV